MVKWKGAKGMAKLMFFGADMAFIRTNVYNNANFDIMTGPYLGFMSFTKKMCGMDLLHAFDDGRLGWGIVDEGVFYDAQFVYKRLDGRHSSATLQFHRHSFGGDDLGNNKKDQFYVVITGLDSVTFKTDMRTCFERFQIGSMQITNDMPAEENHAKCAGWDKDLGW
jgi:hypothetical protein